MSPGLGWDLEAHGLIGGVQGLLDVPRALFVSLLGERENKNTHITLMCSNDLRHATRELFVNLSENTEKKKKKKEEEKKRERRY